MYKANFVPLFENMRQDLERWNSLPVSWLGGISLIKMNILPRLLYPVQMIPAIFSNKVMQNLNGWLSSFIWSKRRPKLKMATLQLPGSVGGLDLPNVRTYQLCTHMRYVYDWVVNNSSSVWLEVEASLSKYPLRDLLFFKKFKNIRLSCNNPITLNTLTWRSVCQLEGRSEFLSVFTLIVNNPDFQPVMFDVGFKQRGNNGVHRLRDLLSDNVVMTFEKMIEKYSVPRHDFFHYLQISHYILHSTTLIELSHERSPVEKLLFSTDKETFVSQFYKTIYSTPTVGLQKLKDTWEEELNITIGEEEWKDVWRHAGSTSVCNHTKEMQLKIIHRMHISPNRRHHFNPSLSPMCLKCKIEIGTLTHCFWSCLKLQMYWSSVLSEIQKILGLELETDHVSLILGFPSRRLTSKHNKRLYCILTYAARKNILLQWIKEEVPTVESWQRVVFALVPLEYLTCILHSKTDQFCKVWEPYLNYVEPDVSNIMLQGFS